MKTDEKQPKEKNGFTYNPELLGRGPRGEMVVLDADHYMILSSASVGRIVYTPKSNKYWSGENAEMPRKTLEEKYLPYLRWDHDVLEDEIVETERENDKGFKQKVKLKTGRKISTFPPTPENIKSVRDKIISEQLAAGKQPNLKEIWAGTSPRSLIENEKFDSMLDKTPFLEKLARKMNRY